MEDRVRADVMLAPHAQNPETLMTAFLMGLAVALLGSVMHLVFAEFPEVTQHQA